MIGLRPRRCSSSHQSSTFAVGQLSLSLNTLIESFFESLLLMFVGLLMTRPWDLGAVAQLPHILPASLLFLAEHMAGPLLDPLAHLGGVPHPSVWRGFFRASLSSCCCSALSSARSLAPGLW